MNETAELFFEYSKQAYIIRRRIRLLKKIREVAEEEDRERLEERIKNLREVLSDVVFVMGCLKRYVPK